MYVVFEKNNVLHCLKIYGNFYRHFDNIFKIIVWGNLGYQKIVRSEWSLIVWL